MRIARKAFVVSAALASVAALSTSAHASGTWSISPAGAISGSSPAGSAVWAVDNHTNKEVDCDSLSASGNVPTAGSGLSGNGIAQVTSVSFVNCVGPQNIGETITVNVSSSNPGLFNAISYDGSDITTGSLTNVSGSITGTDGCVASVNGASGQPGQVNGTYQNSTSTLSLGSGTAQNNLVVTTVNSKCNSTLINVGDTITLNGSVVLNTPVTITSP